MKVLSKEEADAHYAATVRGGLAGGALGLSIGLGSAWLFHHRVPFFRNLTLPLKAFFATSVGSFAAILSADRASRGFESSLHHPGEDLLKERERLARQAELAGMTPTDRLMEFGRENRYSIVGLSWVGSMAASLGYVWRDKYLTKAQKLVQARVYAQGLTLLVLIASAAFEVHDARRRAEGKGKEIHREHYKGEDLWKDMVAQEERRLARVKAEREHEQKS